LTKPTITHSPGIVSDLVATTEALGTWTFNNTNLPGATLTVEHNDWFTIQGTLTTTADEYAYAEIDVANTVSTTLYPYYLLRYKTSASANGLAAKARIIYAGEPPSSEWILTESFSTLFNLKTGMLTSGKIIDKIQLFADDYPNTLNSGTFSVSFDFFLICKEPFAIPNTMYGLNFTPPPKYAKIPIPSRVTDITQNLGSENATVHAICNLDRGNWKRSGDILKGQVFIDIAHNTYQHPFQWLTTGQGHKFKVSLEEPVFRYEDKRHILELLFTEYSRSSKSNESYVERFGLNL